MRFILPPPAIALVDTKGEPYQRLDPDAIQPSQQAQAEGAKPAVIDDCPEFLGWFEDIVLSDEKFNKSFETWKILDRLTDAAKDAREKGLLELEEEDWTMAAEVAKAPSPVRYQTREGAMVRPVYLTGHIARQYLKFIVALAGDVDTKVPTKRPNKAKRAKAAA